MSRRLQLLALMQVWFWHFSAQPVPTGGGLLWEVNLIYRMVVGIGHLRFDTLPEVLTEIRQDIGSRADAQQTWLGRQIVTPSGHSASTVTMAWPPGAFLHVRCHVMPAPDGPVWSNSRCGCENLSPWRNWQ